MVSRSKHPVKELEALLREAEGRHWRVERGGRYFKMYCPCGQHKKTVHLSPSDPNYERNCRSQLNRATCWDREEEKA